MNIPQDCRYLKTHEWARMDSDTATVGITDFAQDQLGDVVFVELPRVGLHLRQGQTVAVVESVKTASDIYSPVSGEVVEVNSRLTDEPELINAGPFGEGWLFRVRLSSPPESLLSPAEYAEVAAAEAH